VIKTILGDCIEEMKSLPCESIDMILVDPPYGTTACKWDSILPLNIMWKQLKRISKSNAAMVFTASQPFTSILINSNLEAFKYEWIWEKSKASNFLQASYMPLKAHENVLVFCFKGKPTFNHQWTYGTPYNAEKRVSGTKNGSNTEVYNNVPNPKHREVRDDGRRNPRTVQYFKTAESEGKVYHPTQKPIALMEYLIKTYSNEKDTILDFTMGSGTTGLACKNTNRNFIGIEQDLKYFNIAQNRLA
jgi:site-specific DNA-methyltransferase (adenine-specific)